MKDLKASTLDDIMYEVLNELLSNPIELSTKRGIVVGEIIGAKITLTNPLARLSRSETRGKPFSAIGELIWYLAQSDDLKFIKYYINKYDKESDDGRTIYGAYGPRLFSKNNEYNQIQNVIDLLAKRTGTRKAVIQLFDAEDISIDRRHVPCTCTFQFLIRDNKLQMVTYMRSNDAYIGLPHDIFAFTMIQEIIAKALGIEMGAYTHLVGSLHLYKESKVRAHEYVDEGLQATTKYMPEMPTGDPIKTIQQVIEIEKAIRTDNAFDLEKYDLPIYWSDIVRLLLLFKHFKNRDLEKINKITSQIHNEFYNSYIEARLRNARFTT